MGYTCKETTIEEQRTISVRTRCAVTELPDTIGRVYGKIMEHLGSVGKFPSGVPYIGYFNMDMEDLDVEIGFPVDGEVPETESIKMTSIPAGRYAETIHSGPYDQLDQAYGALMAWMQETGQDGTGVAYEFYLNDPDEVEPEKLQTDILFQLKE